MLKYCRVEKLVPDLRQDPDQAIALWTCHIPDVFLGSRRSGNELISVYQSHEIGMGKGYRYS
jgi:hypothetical protein